MREVLTLEELAQEPSIILFDTSALITFSKEHMLLDNSTQCKIVKDYYDFLSSIKKHVEKKARFYIPPLVSKEFIGKVLTKKIAYFPLLKLYRKMNHCREEKDLIEAFRENNKIFQLEGIKKNLYDVLYERHFEAKKEYDLSYGDYQFVIEGITEAKHNTVSLVSNDRGVFKAKEEIVKKENISEYRIKFFSRDKSFNFVQIHTEKDMRKVLWGLRTKYHKKI